MAFVGWMNNQQTKFLLWTVIEDKACIRTPSSLLSTLTNSGIFGLTGEFPSDSSQRLVMDVLVRGGDEGLEQRMRLVRLALEFRMKLARHKKRVIFEFDDLDELAVG